MHKKLKLTSSLKKFPYCCLNEGWIREGRGSATVAGCERLRVQLGWDSATPVRWEQVDSH
jgi:hypothetical protein